MRVFALKYFIPDMFLSGGKDIEAVVFQTKQGRTENFVKKRKLNLKEHANTIHQTNFWLGLNDSSVRVKGAGWI